jgi:hypothetical protein
MISLTCCMPAASGVCGLSGDLTSIVQLAGLVLEMYLAKAGGGAVLHLRLRVTQRLKAALQQRVGGQLPGELLPRRRRQVGSDVAHRFRDAQPIICSMLL